MAIDLTNLANKIDNSDTDQGALRADEFNNLVKAVIANQNELKSVVKSVQFGLGTTPIKPDASGNVVIRSDSAETYKFSMISPEETYATYNDYMNSFPQYIISGDSFNIKVRVSFTEKIDDVDTSIKTPLKINFKVGSNIVYSTSIYDFNITDSLIKDSEKTVSFNFAPYLSNNAINTISFDIIDTAENPRIITQTRTFNNVFVVNASCNVSLEGTVNGYNIYNSSSLLNDDAKITISTTSNSGKVSLYSASNSNLPIFVIDSITDVSTSILLKNENLSNAIKQHGTHSIYAVWEYKIPGQEASIDITSNLVSYIFYDTSVSQTEPLASINKISSGNSFQEYSQIILNYLIYLPKNYAGTKELTIITKNTNGEQVISKSVKIIPDEIITDIISGNISYNLTADIKTDQLVSGDYNIIVSFGNIEQSIPVQITQSTINLENYNIPGQIVYFKSANKTPGDTSWSYTYIDTTNNITETYDVVFNNFDFSQYGSCFKNDTTIDGGQTVLTIKRNSSIEIPYPIFAKPLKLEQSEGGVTGKTISVEFKTYNCISQITPIITCYDETLMDDFVGFIAYPNKVVLKTKSGNKFEAKYKEDEQIKLDIVVEGIKTEYHNPTVSGESGEFTEDKPSPEALIIVYVNGVYQRLHKIESENDTFSEYVKDGKFVVNNSTLKIGSEGCDIDLYNIKLYEKALSSKEIVFNYGFDTPKFEDRISIINRNDIWTDAINEISKLYDISRDKLTAKLPNLPIFSFAMHESNNDNLPVDKKNWKFLTKAAYYNKNIMDGNANTGNISWQVTSSALRNQGTSSMNYPMPWRNWDWKPDTDVAAESGAVDDNTDEGKAIIDALDKNFYNYSGTQKLGKYWKQYDNMPLTGENGTGIRKITFKKDYASSEMCNNAICSSLFTDMAIIVGASPDYKGVLMPTGKLNKYGYRLSLTAIPCFMYQELTGNNTGKTKTLGMMNLIPNKNETDYLGLGDVDTRKWNILDILDVTKTDTPRTQAWEVSENHVIWDTKYESYTVSAVLDSLYVNEEKYSFIKDLSGHTNSMYEITVDTGKLVSKDKTVKATEIDLTIQKIQTAINGEDILSYEYYIVKDENNNKVFIKVYDENTKNIGKPDYELKLTAESYGTYINSVLNNYEARYPKDSSGQEIGPKEQNIWDGEEADFGFAPDTNWVFNTNKYTVYTKKDESESVQISQADIVTAETKDILRLHNWLVDCHPAKVVNGGKIRINNIEYDDEVSNRLKKFKEEAKDYLIIDQWILYYLWRELFWMFDSGSKNLQLYTVDGLRWGCMVRDADTALGIDNLGVEMFPPYLEDIDYYTDTNGIEFYFGGAKGKYSIGQLGNTDAKGVLNGQFGSIWLNLRDSYSSEIEAMANLLLSSSANKLTLNNTIAAFDNHQDNWCESLYNFGMRQYFGGDLFIKWIDSGNGNKRLSRKDWLTKAFDYRLGKYKCYPENQTCHMNWRATQLNIEGVETNKELELKFYQPCYIHGGGSSSGQENSTLHERITDFGDTVVKLPIFGWGYPGDGNSESNSYFYGVHNITDFGPLYKTVALADFNPLKALTKIISLELGHHEWSITNNVTYGLAKSLLLNNIPKLQYLDLTNHASVPSLSIDECTQLSVLHLKGTDKLTEIRLPKTNTLTEIHFGKNIKMLDLSDLTNLRILDFQDTTQLNSFICKNCSNEMKKLSYNIVKSSPNLAKVDLDIEWGTETPIDVTDILNLLDKDIDINLRGIVYVKSMTFSQKLQLMSKFGTIDTNNGINNLRVICNQLVEVTGISVNPSVLYAGTIGSLYNISFAPNNDKGNNMLRVTWSVKTGPFNQYFYVIDENGNKTTINNALGNLTIERYGEIVEEPLDGQFVEDVVLTASMHTFKYVNGELIENTDLLTADITIKLYNRDARPGDIVYSDGTYLSAKDHDSSKEVIGICFYAEQKNLNGYYGALTDDVSKQRTTPLRLMITSDLNHEIISNTYPFGLHTNLNPELDFINGSVDNTFNIQSIEDVASSIASFNDWSNYKNTEGNWQFGSKSNNEGKQYAIAQIGPVEKDGIIYSYGEFNTNEIIKHRNEILKALVVKTPQEIYQENVSADPSYTYTEYDDSKECIIQAYKNTTLIDKLLVVDSDNNDNSKYFKLVYYPQASLCYTFEPNVTNKSLLLDKFKKHNWFIGSGGEVFRLAYYINVYNNDKANTNNNPDNIFFHIINKNIIPNLDLILLRIVGQNMSTSSETSNNNYVTLTDWNSVTFSSIPTEKDYANTKQIIPMCKF